MAGKIFNLKGGVLIIGSLLWQNYVRRNNNTIRRDWRDNRLDLSSTIHVKTPIRYGRLSNNGIYTMTFSNSCRGKNIGTGFVIPFRHNPLTTSKQLITEATEIARAEGMEGRFIASEGNGQAWCVLGILINKIKVSTVERKGLASWWHKQVRQDIDYSRFQSSNFKHGSETSCIFQSGILNIPWPTSLNSKDQKELASYDFVIATATLPNELKYPSVEKLVACVKGDKIRKYFWNNVKRGIKTFQDDRVKKRIPQ